MGATDRTARAPERGAAATRATTRARDRSAKRTKRCRPRRRARGAEDGRAWTRADAADGVDGVERPRSAERRRPTTTDARATGTGVDVGAERCGLDAVERSDGDGDGAADGAEGAGGDDAGR